MVVGARDKSQIQQNVVKNVRAWDKFIKTAKRSVPVQGANIVLRANLVKQRVGSELRLWQETNFLFFSFRYFKLGCLPDSVIQAGGFAALCCRECNVKTG
jgi:hypothetical protein